MFNKQNGYHLIEKMSNTLIYNESNPVLKCEKHIVYPTNGKAIKR